MQQSKDDDSDCWESNLPSIEEISTEIETYGGVEL